MLVSAGASMLLREPARGASDTPNPNQAALDPVRKHRGTTCLGGRGAKNGQHGANRHFTASNIVCKDTFALSQDRQRGCNSEKKRVCRLFPPKTFDPHTTTHETLC